MGIPGKGAGCAAMYIARQLVQQQDQCQPTDGYLGPLGQAASGRCLGQFAKEAGYQRIGFAAFSPPEGGLPRGTGGIVGIIAKPEIEQRLPGLHGNSLDQRVWEENKVN
ncbi:hypothetical protein GCM10009412_11490 [Aeromonas salmonicida subsp. achromogenes]